MLSLGQAAVNLGFWREFLLPILFHIVLEVGRAQFGILAGVSFAHLTLCSPQSGPGAIWDFGGSFYFIDYVTLCINKNFVQELSTS